jgi:hypothetical protein
MTQSFTGSNSSSTERFSTVGGNIFENTRILFYKPIRTLKLVQKAGRCGLKVPRGNTKER